MTIIIHREYPHAASLKLVEAKPIHPRLHQQTHARGSAHFKSPGCTSTFSRRLPFSRRQAVGVVAYLNTSTLTAVTNSVGAYRIPRTLFANSALHDANQARSGFAVCLSLSPVLSCSLFHARNKAWSRRHEVHEKSVSGA